LKLSVSPESPVSSFNSLLRLQRRLEELEGLIASLPQDIASHEAVLADAGLYGRDPVRFQKVMDAMGKARAALSAAEDEWLALEEKRESLSS